MSQDQSLRVCYFGTYRQEYSRNQILIEGLRQSGVEVIECHEPLWRGIEDRVQIASGGWIRPGFWWRVAKVYVRLLRRYYTIKDYEILIVGYPGQYDIFLARWLSWLKGKPLVWDVLNSMYLISVERGIAQRHALTAGVIRFLERVACQMPERLILDSPAFVAWFQKSYKLGPDKFWLVPIGADDRVFQQARQEMDIDRPPENDSFLVLYYGTYIPNHGVDIIVEAARLLKTERTIHFEFIGDGPEKRKVVDLANGYDLPNVKFIDWLDKSDLALKVSACDICLGTFGDTLQAKLTNNNKIYEGFAMMKAVISGDSPALPEGLIHGENLYLCKRGDPQALAGAIITLKNNPELRKSLGQKGFSIFHDRFDQKQIGRLFASYLQGLMSG